MKLNINIEIDQVILEQRQLKLVYLVVSKQHNDFKIAEYAGTYERCVDFIKFSVENEDPLYSRKYKIVLEVKAIFDVQPK